MQMSTTTENTINFDPSRLNRTGTGIDLTAGSVDQARHDFTTLSVQEKLDLARAAIWHTDRLNPEQLQGLGRVLSRLNWAASRDSDSGINQGEVDAMFDMYDTVYANRYLAR